MSTQPWLCHFGTESGGNYHKRHWNEAGQTCNCGLNNFPGRLCGHVCCEQCQIASTEWGNVTAAELNEQERQAEAQAQEEYEKSKKRRDKPDDGKGSKGKGRAKGKA